MLFIDKSRTALYNSCKEVKGKETGTMKLYGAIMDMMLCMPMGMCMVCRALNDSSSCVVSI